MKTKRVIVKVVLYSILILGVIISIFPFYWMVVGATNPSSNVYSNPPSLKMGKHFLINLNNLNQSIGVSRVMFNSLFVSSSYTLISIFVTSMAGYAFAKYRFKGRGILFAVILGSMMIPIYATVIPLFKVMAKINWINSYQSLILPFLAYPFAIFLMRQNMVSFPTDIIEAGRIDGVGEIGIFFKIVLPSMKSALAATGIYLFMFQWNNFLWPLVATNVPEWRTMPVALASLKGVTVTDYGQILCGVTLATIPIVAVFLTLQKQFISGMLGSAIK